jgi:hypothetical protein
VVERVIYMQLEYVYLYCGWAYVSRWVCFFVITVFSRGVVRIAAASNVQSCGWWVVRAPCSSFVKMTYRLSAALRQLWEP